MLWAFVCGAVLLAEKGANDSDIELTGDILNYSEDSFINHH